jgi:hypothetical protein
MKNVPTEMIQNAFITCGLVPEEMFDFDKLHGPLKTILGQDFERDLWDEDDDDYESNIVDEYFDMDYHNWYHPQRYHPFMNVYGFCVVK